MADEPSPACRTALVMTAGGLRGAAHVGVLRRLLHAGIRLDAIVGVSAGAIVAAYYAAVGLEVDELAGDAESFRGRHLITYGLDVHIGHRYSRLRAACGVIPARLRQLETATFDRLHHGVRRLGIVCHDRRTARAHYFATGSDQGVCLNDAVLASASIPHLFPPVRVQTAAGTLELLDGGLTDAVPIAFARSPAIGATHVIVSDSRWFGRAPRPSPSTVWIRPRMLDAGTLWTPRHGLVSVVRAGEAAVTDGVLARIREWTRSG